MSTGWWSKRFAVERQQDKKGYAARVGDWETVESHEDLGHAVEDARECRARWGPRYRVVDQTTQEVLFP